MKTLAITRTVLFGEPPQKFVVAFAVGSPYIRVTGPGSGGKMVQRVLGWTGKNYRPGCLAMTEQVVARFIGLEANMQPDDRLDEGNDELAIAGRLPAPKTPGRVDYHERQLPRSDRQGVG